PAPQSEQENCVAHNGSIVPVPGRDIFVQAWYQGGMSVIDFTDSANPTEIAYFDRGPIHEERLILGGYWSTYWYQGKIYGTAIVRGLDVFELNESDMMSANEIAAASVADQGALFNPQQQFAVTWPKGDPSVALAYVDQLVRSKDMSAEDAAEYADLISAAAQAVTQSAKNRSVSNRLRRLARDLNVSEADTVSGMRQAGLQSTLRDLANRIR
ncbi:MAG: DUF305 domain-containing protein, partial [Pseudomonadota bacterium]